MSHSAQVYGQGICDRLHIQLEASDAVPKGTLDAPSHLQTHLKVSDHAGICTNYSSDKSLMIKIAR